MRTLIVVPAYNEEKAILGVAADIRRCYPQADLIVINDCSTDGTAALLAAAGVPHLSLAVNLGIGGCVQTGYQYALERGYELVVQFDGDGQHDARYLPDLIRPIEAGEADLVIGSRFLEKQGFQSGPLRRVGIRFLSGLVRALGGVRVSDVTSGMRAAGPRLAELYARTYAQDYPEPEALLLAAVLGARIAEVPVKMRPRQGGESSIGPLRAVYYIIKVTLALLMRRFLISREGV